MRTKQTEIRKAPPLVRDVLREEGAPLGSPCRAFFELRFGHDFSKVRVHTGARASESAEAVDAQAYTVGEHVVFRSGKYEPATEAGRKSIAHELAHVVQQSRAAATSTLAEKSVSIGDRHDAFEQDAELRADGVVPERPLVSPSLTLQRQPQNHTSTPSDSTAQAHSGLVTTLGPQLQVVDGVSGSKNVLVDGVIVLRIENYQPTDILRISLLRSEEGVLQLGVEHSATVRTTFIEEDGINQLRRRGYTVAQPLDRVIPAARRLTLPGEFGHRDPELQGQPRSEREPAIPQPAATPQPEPRQQNLAAPAPAAHQPVVRDAAANPNALSPNGRQFLFDREAQRGVSSHTHWPHGASGVTIGPGYDMGGRTAQQVQADLIAVGVDTRAAQALSGGAGLHGVAAQTFAREHRNDVTLTNAQEMALMGRVLVPYERAVHDAVTVPITDEQYTALVSLAYNIGIRRFRHSALLRALNACDMPAAARHFDDYIRSGGQVLPGLRNRRNLERRLFQSQTP